MRRKPVVAALLFGSLQTIALAQQNRVTQSWEIPFTLYKQFMVVVQGAIGEVDGLNFLVDTGTNPSVVDKRITRKLHLAGWKSSLPVVSGEVATGEVLVPSVNIGPVSRSQVRMAIQDMTMLERDLGIRIDAMIGLDVLGGQNFRIDYETRSITFGPTRSVPAGAAEFQSQPPFVTVEMKMNRQPLHLLVDTGSPELVLFESRIGPLSRLPGVNRISQNLNGEVALREVQLSETQLGATSFGAKRAYVASDRNRAAPFDGLLGVSALHVRQISFDFERRLFTWQGQDSWIPTMTGAEPGNCTVAEARAAMSQGLSRIRPGCIERHPQRLAP